MKGEGLHGGQAQIKIGDAQPVHQELAELPGDGGDALRLVVELALVRREQHRVLVPQHGGARAGRADDDLGVFESFEEVLRDRARFIAIAGVEGGLAAASLRRREVDADADVLEDFDHGHTRARVDHVHDAGDEKGDRFADGRFARG